MPEFAGVLYAILKRHPEGIKEYDLINLLKQPEQGVFEPELDFGDPLVLFQTHFILFHQLYMLRDQLLAEQSGDLSIHTTHIALKEYQPGQAGITETDRLRAYYLDLSELEKTGVNDVEQLLNGFWQNMDACLSDEERLTALSELGLDADASEQSIKRQYRKLMHQYHPDKHGGSLSKSQSLTAAYRKLI
ncbi:hypothetical protein HMF8227_01881 [Saliniradius amylolyticus]|uniref:J domain-containing protein n=2 Tax=Saliniradius amylolyticus TaxID=2183582 RepID=A0A2S2E3X3_9ALTE|nr:hypothetical protein HMF8227_01881 [Saliniradius amylolyticus]